MAMLFQIDCSARDISQTFEAAQGNDPWQGGRIAPGMFAPVITTGREFIAGPRPQGEPPRRIVPRLWGVPPPPSAGSQGSAVLTVRNPDSPFWIGNLRNSEFRCLISATSIMGWGREDPLTGKRRAHWYHCADQRLFAMAGVWKDSEVPSFALLTCAANAVLRDLGIERMPAILPADPRIQRQWLMGGWDRARQVIMPYSSGMTVVEV